MNLGSKGISGNVLQYFTRHTTPDLQKNKEMVKKKKKIITPNCTQNKAGVPILQEKLPRPGNKKTQKKAMTLVWCH